MTFRDAIARGLSLSAFAFALLASPAALAASANFVPGGLTVASTKVDARVTAVVAHDVRTRQLPKLLTTASGAYLKGDLPVQAWAEALRTALAQTALFAGGSSRPVTVSVDVREIFLPLAGATITATAAADYKVVDDVTGAALFSASIPTEGSYGLGDYLIGAKRGEMALNLAVQRNIQQFLERLEKARLIFEPPMAPTVVAQQGDAPAGADFPAPAQIAFTSDAPKPVTKDVIVEGRLAAGGGDCYALATKPGERITITLRSAAFDGRLVLARGALCSASALQTENNDFEPAGHDAQIAFTAAGGRYLIQARSNADRGEGEYLLAIEGPLDTQGVPDPGPQQAAEPAPAQQMAMASAADSRRALMEQQVNARRAQVAAEEEAKRRAEEQRQAELAAQRAAQRAAEQQRRAEREQAFNAFIGASVMALSEVSAQMQADSARIAAQNAANADRQMQQAQAARNAQIAASQRAAQQQSSSVAALAQNRAALVDQFNQAKAVGNVSLQQQALDRIRANNVAAAQLGVQSQVNASTTQMLQNRPAAPASPTPAPERLVGATPEQQRNYDIGASFVPPAPQQQAPRPSPQATLNAQAPASTPPPPPKKVYPSVPEAVAICVSRGKADYFSCYSPASRMSDGVDPTQASGWRTPQEWQNWVGGGCKDGPHALNDGGVYWRCGYGVDGRISFDIAPTAGAIVQRGVFYCDRGEAYCRRRTPQ